MSASLKIVTQAMGATYYSKDNYYTKEGTIQASRWYGQGAARLGLSGDVDDLSFQRLLDARNPKTGELLPGYQRKSHAHQSGVDVTFAGPKSLSLLALLMGRREALEAFDAAVEKQIVRLEDLAYTRVQKDGVRQRVQTKNIVVAGFQHDTNRLNEPLLHTHCVILGVTQMPDGTWKSLQANTFWALSKDLNDTFMRDLEAEVNARGIETVPSSENGFWEIKGFERMQLEAFSTMSRRVEALWDFTPPVTLSALVDVEGNERARAAHQAAVKGAIRQLTKDAELGDAGRAQEVYLAHLERELWRRGFETQSDHGRNLQIAFTSRASLDAFEARGRPSSLQVQSKARERIVKLDIRPPKGAPQSREALHAQWEATAEAVELSPTFETLREVASQAVGEVTVLAHRAAEDESRDIEGSFFDVLEEVSGVDLTSDYRVSVRAMERQVMHLVLGAASADVEMSLKVAEVAQSVYEADGAAAKWEVVGREAEALGFGEFSNVISFAQKKAERNREKIELRSPEMTDKAQPESQENPGIYANIEDKFQELREGSQAHQEQAAPQGETSFLDDVREKFEEVKEKVVEFFSDTPEELEKRFMAMDDKLSQARYEQYTPVMNNEEMTQQDREFMTRWDERMGALQSEIEACDPKNLTSEKVEYLEKRYEDLREQYAKEAAQEQTQGIENEWSKWEERKDQGLEQRKDQGMEM